MNADFYLQDLKTKFEKINSGEYFLSYSGGRDSHFLYWFIKEYLHDDKIKIVSVNTYMEHPQILQRMRENADVILYPELKPYEIKEKYGSPCFSKFQDEMISRYQNGSRSENTMGAITGEGRTVFKINKTAREMLLSDNLHKVSNKCCYYSKKKPLQKYAKETNRKSIIAVRESESNIRKYKSNTCFDNKGNFKPIHDLTEETLKEIESKYNIETPQIYNYISRTGCMGCPYGSWKHGTEKELQLITPAQHKFVCDLFKESYEVLGVDTEYKPLLRGENI